MQRESSSYNNEEKVTFRLSYHVLVRVCAGDYAELIMGRADMENWSKLTTGIYELQVHTRGVLPENKSMFSGGQKICNS